MRTTSSGSDSEANSDRQGMRLQNGGVIGRSTRLSLRAFEIGGQLASHRPVLSAPYGPAQSSAHAPSASWLLTESSIDANPLPSRPPPERHSVRIPNCVVGTTARVRPAQSYPEMDNSVPRRGRMRSHHFAV